MLPFSKKPFIVISARQRPEIRICKSIILPVVCYNYKVWYFALIDIQVLNNRGMKKFLASEWAELSDRIKEINVKEVR
jgi:hypothetical protein